MFPALAPTACLGQEWHVTPDLALRLAVIAGLVALAACAAARRFFPGQTKFVALCAVIAAWTAASVAEHAASSAQCKVTLALASWLAILWTAPLWALFVSQYLNSATRGPTLRLWLLIASAPAALMVAVASNGIHGWFYGPGTALGPPIAGLPRLRYDYGPLFWTGVAVGYFWLVVAAVQVVRGWLQARAGQRGQWLAFLLVMAIPVAFNIAYLAFGVRLFGADPTGIGFFASVLGFAGLIQRNRLFDVVPLARRVLFMELPDPVLVLDAEGRVVEANTAAQFGARPPLTRPLTEWPRVGAALASHLAGAAANPSLVLSDPFVVYEVGRRDLGEGARRIGTMVVLYDITAHRRAHSEVVEALAARDAELSTATAVQAHLREQALLDPLTGVQNRRALEERFREEAARAQRNGHALTLVLADLDHFKGINDRYGHASGDAVLRDFAAALRAAVRATDAVFRIGGEEFAMLMPAAGAAHAAHRLALLSDILAERHLGELADRVTFSAGIVSSEGRPMSLEALLAEADAALYRAKTEGRDRSVIA